MTTAALKSSIHIWSDPNNTTERQQLNAWIKAASCDELEDMMNFYEQYMASNPVAAPFSEHLNQSIEFKIDDWENPTADLTIQSKTIKDVDHSILYVPNGFAFAFKALEPNSQLLVYGDFGIGHAPNDDHVFPVDYFFNSNIQSL